MMTAAATIGQRARGRGSQKERAEMDLPKDGLGRKNEGMEEGGRGGPRADRSTTTTGGPGESCLGKGAAVGGRGDSPRSFVDDWMDSHSSADIL